MPNRSGRPAKGDQNNSKEKIINTTVSIIRKKGADSVTVRNVCTEAGLSIGTFYHYFRDKDDLLMYFLRETSFDSFDLETSVSDIAGRISELYMHLIRRYMELGLVFMKSFYSTGNRSLSAYMGEVDGTFASGTVMARSETEIQNAQDHGIINENADVHELCMDICTIVKGCVFEWCLTDGTMDIETTLYRIIRSLITNHLASIEHK
ncbi:MAG: TetR/AcrR family transcriptional regulator [Lachnospiraceae bacterium]|nr:TetR/AcrR family transcriptional regulator [Lachnospiraceae bacterium]